MDISSASLSPLTSTRETTVNQSGGTTAAGEAKALTEETSLLPPAAENRSATPGLAAVAIPEPSADSDSARINELLERLKADLLSMIRLIGAQSRQGTLDDALDSIKNRSQGRIDLLTDAIGQINAAINAWLKALEEEAARKTAEAAEAGEAKPQTFFGESEDLELGKSLLFPDESGGTAAGNISTLLTSGPVLSKALTGLSPAGGFFPGRIFGRLFQNLEVDERMANLSGAILAGGLLMLHASASVDGNKIIRTLSALVQATLNALDELRLQKADEALPGEAGPGLKEFRTLLEKLRAAVEQEEDFRKALEEEEKSLAELLRNTLEALDEAVRPLTGGALPLPEAAPEPA